MTKSISLKRFICMFLSATILISVFLVSPNTAENVQAAASAPGGLKVEAYSDTVAKIVWSKSAGVTGYVVYRSTDGKNFSGLKVLSSSYTGYTDSGLTPGKTYYYSVASYNKVNGVSTIGTKSSAIKVTTTTSARLPVPTSFEVTAFSSDAVKLSWKAVSNVNGYIIYRSTNGKSYKSIKTLSSSYTSYTNTGLDTGKSYYYKIASYRKANSLTAIGPKSSAVKGTTTSTPVTVSKVLKSSSAIRLYWKKISSAAGYQIFRYNSQSNKYTGLCTLSSSTLTWADRNLKSKTTYTYKIRAYYKINGVIAYSPYTLVTAKTDADSITGVKAAATSYSSIKVSWDQASGASGYQIYMLAPDDSDYRLIHTSGANEFSYVVTMLSPSTTYSFKVRAVYKTSASQTYGEFGTASAKTLSAEKESVAAEILYNKLNSVRKDNGVRLLARTDTLDKVASLRAEEISQNFSGTRPNGKSWASALSDANLVYAFAAENRAFGGYQNVESIVEIWLHQDMERKNVLSPNYNQVGVGVYYSNGIPFYCVIFYRPFS